MPTARYAFQRGRDRAKRQVTKALIRDRKMMFPSFSPATNDSLLGHNDYTRLATMLLAIKRLDAEGIAGAVAEVGVWRGDTSLLLHGEGGHRPFHLFDTFEGFHAEELGELNSASDGARFQDTSVQFVRSRFPAEADITTHPGHVPATLQAVAAETFSFVLIDLDVGAPTTASLEFFYPRLANGAFVFVHDYNSTESDWACKRALDAFLADKPERLVEVPDRFGSALFRRA